MIKWNCLIVGRRLSASAKSSKSHIGVMGKPFDGTACSMCFWEGYVILFTII